MVRPFLSRRKRAKPPKTLTEEPPRRAPMGNIELIINPFDRLELLPQHCVDKIATYLDPPSIYTMENCCQSLRDKFILAERSLELHVDKVYYMSKRTLINCNEDVISFNDSVMSVEQFRQTAVSLYGKELCIPGNLNDRLINEVLSCFGGRSKFDKLTVSHDLKAWVHKRKLSFSRFREGTGHDAEAASFESLLQEFGISSLNAYVLPEDYFETIAVSELVELKHEMELPVLTHLIWIYTLHYCDLHLNGERPLESPIAVNMALQEWIEGTKIIKDYILRHIDLHNPAGVAFEDMGYMFVDAYEDIDKVISNTELDELPLLIHSLDFDGAEKYRLIRADKAVLYLRYVDGCLRISDEEKFDFDSA